MQALEIYRRTLREEAARELGVGAGMPRLFASQTELSMASAALAVLPTVHVDSPIITDPGHPQVGKKRFILGISRLGSDDVMV